MAANAVWKCELQFDAFSVAELMCPLGAEFRHVAMQHGKLCVWAEVDPEMPITRYKLRVAGTGYRTIKEGDSYIGTVVLQEGDLVLHFYEVNPRSFV